MKHYACPTQVKFYDIDGDHYIGGIAYGNCIICGCCGGMFKISEIIEHAPTGIEPIIDLEWIDIDKAIAGE